MKIKTIIKGFLLTAAAAVAICCQKEEGETTKQDITQDLEFTKLEVEACGYNSAEISVRHSGTTTDTWYGFVTTDTKKKDILLIAEETKKGKLTKLNKGVSKRVKLTDLNPATKYKYIVFAITEDGQLYGTAKSVTFDTKKSAFLLSQCEDWTVSREKRDAATNKENYSVVFNAQNASRCHVGFIPKWMVEYYENDQEAQAEIEEYGGLRLKIGEQIFLFTILDYLVWEELYEYWGYYDSDESYFLNETFGESSVIAIPRQESGDYYAVAIGFNDEGTPTFKYSANEVTIDKETASDKYSKWLGEWTATGSNGISYTLRLEENDPNYSFYVYGWECDPSKHNDKCANGCTKHEAGLDFTSFNLGIPFYFDALNGDLTITSKRLRADQMQEGSKYDLLCWGLYGYTESEGETVAILDEDDNIAKASLPESSSTTLNGLQSKTYKFDSNGNAEEVEFTYKSLSYIQYGIRYETDDEGNESISSDSFMPVPWNNAVEFPIELTKKTEATENSANVSHLRQMQAKELMISIKNRSYNRSIKRADITEIL